MISRFLLFLSVVFLGIGQIWGQTTVTSNFGATSGSIDSNISFTTEKNSAQSPPAWNTNSNELRLYYHSSGNGGSVTLHPAEGIIITDVSLTTASTSYTPTVKYNIDGGGDQTAALSGTTYTISGIEASDNLRIRNANTTNTQLRLTGITVTYEFATTDPIFNTSETEITGLGYMEGNASVSQSFSLSGMNLEPTSGNITVTAPANFQVSTDDISFSNSLNIAYSDGALASTNVYVRLSESLAINTYNGNITISGGSANAIVSVEGVVTEFSSICGEETFDNASLTTGYADGSFVGNNGITWTYGHSRNEDTFPINDNGLMLRNASESYLEATISGGIGTFSFDYRKAYTGSNARQLELLVDGVQVATTDVFGGSSGEDNTIYNLSYDINKAETVTIRIKNVGSTTTNRQTVLDNITWTCYSSTPTPQISVTPSGNHDFGNQLVGSTSTPETFTIANTGNADLTIGTIALSGANADQFSITQAGSSTITQGNNTTFTVSFSPTSLGSKTATVTIPNNDEDYTFTVTGNGSNSASSDIATNTSYSYTENILYANYQTPTITNTSNSVGVFQFAVRDGGGDNDGDDKPTTLTGIAFNYTGSANTIRAAALFIGNEKIADGAVSANGISFSGLNIVAPDNDSSPNITLRVSFTETVTDKEKLVFTVASATADASGSVFAQADAGGAFSDNNNGNNRNRIEVVADRLAYAQQPTTTSINTAMSPAVTVSANDIFGNRDLDFTETISISSYGDLTGDPVTQSAISGLATFSNLIHTVAETGIMLEASYTTWSIESNEFDITEIVYANGDYRTTGSGNWVSNNSTPAIWEQFNGTTWTTSNSPSYNTSNNVYIRDGHTITTEGSFGSSVKLKIMEGGVFNANHSSTAENIYVYGNGTLNVNAALTIASSGTLEVENGGTLNFNRTSGNFTTSIFNGTEIFHPESNFVVKNFNDSYLLNTSVSTNTFNGYTAAFGNVIIDIDNSNNNLTLIASGMTSNFAHGNLEFRNYNETTIRLSTTGTVTSGIGGDFIVDDLYPGNNVINLKTSGTLNFTIGGNMQLDAATVRNYAGSNATGTTLNILGDFSITPSAVFDFNSTSASSPYSIVNLYGNLYVAGSGLLQNANTQNLAQLNFVGTGDGLAPETTQTIDVANASTLSNITFNVNNNAYVRLINQNLTLGTNSKFNVKSGGTLDFGFNASDTPLIITNSGNGQSFIAESGSTLKITSPDGITSTANLGNVQTPVDNRTFNAGATYHYIGKTNQATGNGLPDGITGKLIIELETDASNENLEFTSTGTNTFGTVGGVNGILEIRKGRVIDQPNKGFRNYNGTTNENEDGESDPQKGDIIMTGGRYVVSGGGTKPSLSGSYTLTDGTVEFAGTANTKIRVKPLYHNMDVSGSNVTAGGKNLIVNNLTKVIGTGKLTIPETDDSATPYVLTARKGIQVASGATALFENNANLMQDPGAANSGKISMLRKANVPSNQYNYWASPVSGQNLYEIYNVPNNRVMIYNTDDDYFTIKPNPHQSEFGIGYSIKGPVTNEPQTPSGSIEVVANFIGTPRNEPLTGYENQIPLSDEGNHYNLIGNPFPSNLDLIALYNDSDNNTKFFDDGTEDTPTAYFWDNVSNTQMTQQGSNYNQSNYALLNLSSGIGTAAPCNSATCSGVASGKKPNGIVKPGQGFIIRAAEGADHLTLKNDMRTTLIKRTSDDDEAVYFKTGNLSAEHNGERPRNDKFWVELVTADDLHIQAAVGYFTQAENSFERFDSKVMNEDASDNIYTLSEDDVKLSIQGRKGNFSNEDIIPLGVRFFKYGIHKIQLEETKGIFKEHQDIYVKDKYLNITHNLSANGPYLIDAQAGEFNDRFEIVFKPSLSSTVNPASPLNSLKIEKRDHQIEISSSVEKITEVEIFNLSGWSVYKAEQVNENILKIPASQFGKEIIIVNVQTESGKTETKKIINK